MSGIRVSDPSRLHLKKELTQIRKAARVLRDPGTTSSWKSPLSSTRSIAAATAAEKNRLDTESSRRNESILLESQLPLQIENDRRDASDKDKKVFLYNWKNQQSSSEKSALARNAEEDEEERDGDDGSSWVPASGDDDMSDARNGGDLKSDAFLGANRSVSTILRCRDTNLIPLGIPNARRAGGSKKKSKKSPSNLDLLSRYKHKDLVLDSKSTTNRRLRSSHVSSALGVGRGDSVEQSDDSEDYSNSEDLQKPSGASPLFLKLKQKNCSRSSSKLLKTSRREDSSCTHNSTPALSTSSYYRHGHRNPSTVGSWDATTTNDGDDDEDDPLDLPGRQGCGIPCYWSKRTPKHRGRCRSCCSPSLSDTLRRKGSSILCGSQSVYRRHQHSSSVVDKRKIASRSAQGVLPLLTYGGSGRGSSIGTAQSDDELSTNFGELDLEAKSRLDGRRWSTSCRSQEGMEIVALNGEGDEDGTPENIRSFSQKYKPMFFDELIGQTIVVQSLINAVSRGRIAPVYLFQGPRGTGKTSAARIFAAALNCLATEEMKPCGYCKECADFISGKSRDFYELDGANKKGVDRVKYLLKNLLLTLPLGSSKYKVFVVDECHLLPSKTWLSFLKYLEDPPPQVVFTFITTDLENVPRTIQSRCQKYLFNKIKDDDIIDRLREISAEESLDVESQALDLIALNADGSLRDAETMLEQLSLLGKRITTSLVNELVGVVSDEKLLELLELALSSDTAETVRRARELMDSGADPIVLMSQLASLIMDIIAGTYKVVDSKYSNSFLGGNLTEADVERLKNALKLLSDAEKQLRVSSERPTWFTATLLQLGSMTSVDFTQTSSSHRQSSRTTEDDPSSTSREAALFKHKLALQHLPGKSASPLSVRKAEKGSSAHRGKLLSEVNGYKLRSSDSWIEDSDTSSASQNSRMVGNVIFTYKNSDKLDDIWAKCIERCHSMTLRQLLRDHGKLLSISEVEGTLVAYIAFRESDIKSRAERFLSSITNSMEIVLRCNVEVRTILLPEVDFLCLSQSGAVGRVREEAQGVGNSQSLAGSHALLAEDNAEAGSGEESRPVFPMQRIESIIREQRLETAWLQAAERGTPGSLARLRPEKNQVLPQEGIYGQTQSSPGKSPGMSSQKWADDLSNDVIVEKPGDVRVLQKDQAGKRVDHYPLSSSLLHDSSFPNNIHKDCIGYESSSGGGGCSDFFCWSRTRHRRRGKVKGTSVRTRSGRYSLFRGCVKPRKAESRSRR